MQGADATVAVLGTGAMGTPIARRLLDAGFSLRVWNRTRARAQPLAADGAHVAASPSEAAEGADVVLTMLSDGSAIEHAMLGPDGALPSMHGNAVWLQMSTVGPRWTDHFAGLADEHGVELVDAPVSGSDEPAREGKLIVLASGPDHTRECVQPLFDAIGRRTLWLGPAGAGSRLKLVVNNWLVCLVEAAAETLALADALELDEQLFLDAIDGGPLASPYAVTKSKAMIDRDYAPGFPLRHALKDVLLTLSAAGAADIALPLTATLAPRWRRLAETGHADQDVAVVMAGMSRAPMSEVVQVGVSHRSAPLGWRERVAIGSRAVGPAAARLARSAAAREALVLATCSRVEAYAVGPDAGRLEDELLGRLARRAGCPRDELATVVDVRHGTDAARHLLRTAAGLESPVLGEPEILGQLRHAHRSAAAEAATGPALEQLVAHAVRAGRRVRAETGLGTGAASLTSAVAALARRVVGSPAGRRALVIGDTRTAGAAAERLLGDGWAVTTCAVTPGPEPALASFDVVVACSGAGSAIGREALDAAGRMRTSTPLLVADLSVPRDVDPATRSLPGIVLYDVDDIAGAGRHALAARRTHVPAAEAVVEEELRSFEAWRATRALVPTIKAMREHQRRAIIDVLGELPDDLVERLVTRLAHAPTARMRAAAAAGDGVRWAATARELFALDDGGETLRAEPPPRPRADGAAP